MRTLVVIVNYRTAGLTLDCLESLAGDEDISRSARVVVVDNASGDDSVALIEQRIASRGWQGWASVIAAPFNGGFSYGNNLAIRPALASATPPDAIWLLNSDTVVRPGALGRLTAVLQQHPQAGIVGSRLEHHDCQPQYSRFRFPTLASDLDNGLQWGPLTWLLSRYVTAPPIVDHAAPSQWVSGASMLIRRQVFEQIGYFDEGYFLYFEELDFCRRAADAQWQCWYEPASRVVHLIGRSTGVTNRSAARRQSYWFNSRKRYLYLHHRRWHHACSDLIWLVTYPLWRLRAWMQRKPVQEPPRLWWDFARHSVFWRGFKA